LSAAKKYESQEAEPEPSLLNSSPAFLARRVEIIDDDGSAATPEPASALPPSPVVASPTEPKPRKVVNTSVKAVAVNEPVAPTVVEPAPEPVKDDPPPVSVTVNDPFEDMEPGGTKLAAPLPVRIPKCFQAVCMEPEPKDSDISGLVDAPLVDLAPVSPTPAAPGQASPAPLSPAPVSAVTEIPVWTEPEIAPKPSLKPSSGVDTLATLSDTLIAFDSSSTSFWDDKPVMTEEEAGSANIQTTENGVEREAELSNCIPITDDLLALTDGPEESVDPVPPSPGRWSQDLLGGLNSESIPAKTSGTLDLLADDVIPIKTEARSLNMQREEEQTDETARETQSQEDNTDPWSSRETTTVTESSSDDPFDPYPIGTTSSNSASDLLQPHSGISSNSASFTFMENKDPSPETDIGSNALESLADNVFPINTESTSLGTERSWARTWETSPPQQANSDESQEAVPGGQTVDQETLVMFERKSSENDSPWDRWTSPIVYTLATEEEEEEEEEKESREYTETVTTITTNREIHSEQQLAMDRYETYSRSVTKEDQRAQTPEPEAKKGFVYLKEYVNATELSLHNARDSTDKGSDYFPSSSASYSYSSPSTYSSGLSSSTCNFCEKPVGNDAKITIEHLNINCHPDCFKCGVCGKHMGDLLDSMFLHGGKVHCETCYSNALD